MATCPACTQKVYKAEEVAALGKSWHKLCFACQVCKKSMNPGDALDHDGLPYCRAHYAKLFGPKGMIQGVVADTGFAATADARASIDTRGTRQDFQDPLQQKSSAQRTGVAGSVAGSSGQLTEAQMAAERNRQAIRAAERAMEDEDDDPSDRFQSMRFQDPVSVTSSGSVGAKGKLFSGKKLEVGGGDACKLCGKPVGFADKITGIGGKWHKTCFKCQFCGKTFASAGDATEGNGMPTCTPCYKREFPSSRRN